jgi:cytidylate kinase
MSIITISRGSYSRGKEVAEALAERLGYECVSRDILLEACQEFAIPEIRLVKALHDAPRVLERFHHGKERYISYFRAAFLSHMAKDNVVYHGLAGHFFLQDITHALKVRILANFDSRVKEEMKRENCTEQEARFMLKKDDDERRRWGLALYGRDTWNSSLYDMVLHIDVLQVEDVVEILFDAIKKGRYETTPESQAMLAERALLANIHAQVVNMAPRVTVAIEDGVVTLGNLEGTLSMDGALRNNQEQRRKTAAMLIEKYGLKDVVFDKPVKGKKDYINIFHTIDGY